MQFKTKLLKQYTKLLLKNGFRVYEAQEGKFITFILIEKNGNLGYVQDNYFGGLDFITNHKPCLKYGTGFKLNNDGVFNPTIEHALFTFILCPHWGNCDVIKYKSIDEYKELNKPLKYVEIRKVK